MLHNPSLCDDLVAISNLLRASADEGKTYTKDGLIFLADTIDKVSDQAKQIEEAQRENANRLCAAQARIEALTLPDYVRQTRLNIAIREGRVAGVVVDLRDVFARELAQQPVEVAGDANGDAKGDAQ